MQNGRTTPPYPESIELEYICDAAREAVRDAWDNAPDGYRDVNSREELKTVLPQSWYDDEKSWLKRCLGREPTKIEWFLFWMYWRMWMMQAKHDGGLDHKLHS